MLLIKETEWKKRLSSKLEVLWRKKSKQKTVAGIWKWNESEFACPRQLWDSIFELFSWYLCRDLNLFSFNPFYRLCYAFKRLTTLSNCDVIFLVFTQESTLLPYPYAEHLFFSDVLKNLGKKSLLGYWWVFSAFFGKAFGIELLCWTGHAICRPFLFESIFDIDSTVIYWGVILITYTRGQNTF